MINKNLIKFIPTSIDAENCSDSPMSSKNKIPEWYKDIKPIKFKDLIVNPTGGFYNFNIKQCMPFLDALTSGYVQETWCDINIEVVDNLVKYNWSNVPKIIGHRESVNIEINNNFYQMEFVWHQYWMPKVPKGYSVLITHPFNRLDLPFYTLSGIIDSDNFYHYGNEMRGNIPFYIYKNFEGIIPAGTPMFQIFPFKREKWISKKIKYNLEKLSKNNNKLRNTIIDSYKTNFWHKKNYYE